VDFFDFVMDARTKVTWDCSSQESEKGRLSRQGGGPFSRLHLYSGLTTPGPPLGEDAIAIAPSIPSPPTHAVSRHNPVIGVAAISGAALPVGTRHLIQLEIRATGT